MQIQIKKTMETTKNFTPEALVEAKKILEVSVSCESAQVAYTVKKFTVEKKSSTMDIFVYNAYDNGISQVTRSGMSCTPQLIHNYGVGTVNAMCFLRDGQIWTLPSAGGEAFQVTHFPLEVNGYRIYKNELDQLWLIATIEVYAGKSMDETVILDKPDGSSAVIYDKLMVRHWDRWGSYRKRNHLFLFPLEVTECGLLQVQAGSSGVDLMKDWESDCPGKAAGQGCEDFDVSPNGLLLAFACRNIVGSGDSPHAARADMAWNTDNSVYLLKLPKHFSELSAYTSSLTKLPPAVSATMDRSLLGVFGDSQYCVLSDVCERAGKDGVVKSIGFSGCPLFSPDGAYVAYLCRERSQFESDCNLIKIARVPTDTSKWAVNHLTKYIDVSFDCLEWGRNTSTHFELFTTGMFQGSNKLFKLSIAHDGAPKVVGMYVLAGSESNAMPKFLKGSRSGEDKLFYLHTSFLCPPILKSITLKPNDNLFVDYPLGVTDNLPSSNNANSGSNTFKPVREGAVEVSKFPDSAHVQEVFVSAPEFTNNDIAMPDELLNHYFIGGGGDLVQAWFMHPVGVNISEHNGKHDVPLVVLVHGGPQGCFANTWSYRWNAAWFAGLGYGVAIINFHGSTGYGQDFVDSITGDWGGKPFEDIIKGTDYFLKQYSYLNPNKIGAAGGSYGGYMMNWINGHAGKKFSCLVNHAGVFSTSAMYFTTEEVWFTEWEFGIPWKDADEYKHWSPSTYIGNWETPTLVIHGGKDFRVPETEGLGTFTSLQRRGVPSKFLYFPDENHWILRPLNSIKWHNNVSEWFSQYLK